MWIVKVDPDANNPTILGARNYGGAKNDRAFGLQTYTYNGGGTANRRVAVIGESYSFSAVKRDVVLVNFDENFGTAWATRYDLGGPSPQAWNTGFDVIQKPSLSPNGEMVLVGQTNSGSFPMGIGWGMEVPAGGGGPISSFSYVYGDAAAHNSLNSLTCTQSLLTPYNAAGRTDLFDAGDQYSLELSALGHSGNIGGAGCELALVADAVDISPVPLRLVVPRMDVINFQNTSVRLRLNTIGRLAEICSP